MARFSPFESSEGYLWVLRRMVREYGISPSIYQDRLAAELHRAGTTDKERANLFLEGFLEAHNQRFSRASEKPQRA